MMVRTCLCVLTAVFPLCSSNFLSEVGDSSKGSVADVIRALDTDHSGSVEQAEIEAYATKRGLSAAETRKEFQDLDKNGDGILDADEIGSSIGLAEETAKPGVKVTQISPVTLSTAGTSPPAIEDTPSAAAKQVSPLLAPVVPEVAFASAKTGAGVDLMDESALLLEVRGQANSALAEVFAQQAQDIFARRAHHEEDAAKLEENARVLRQNVSDLMSSAPQIVADASVHVVEAHTQQKFGDASALLERAREADQAASVARSEALQAAQQAKNAQGFMMAAVQQLRARGA